MKKLLSFIIAISFVGTIAAQVTFTNQSGLLGNYADSSEAAADMNNDGLDDYIRVSSNGIGIDYQNPDGTFTSQMHSMSIQNVPNWSIAIGDLDGNGYNDLVLGNGQRVSFVLANADGTAYTETTHPEFIFSQRSTMVDIDNDGDLDSFVCHDVDLSHPYRNDGNGVMTLDQSLIQTIDERGNYANIWVDYDNDGDLDMYMTKCVGGSSSGDPRRDNAMYTNNGDGTFTENAADINMKDNAQSWTTVFEDFDNDGDFDAFIVNHDFQNRFMLNDGSGVYTDIIGSTGIDPNDLGAWENNVGDFNNDGFVDIFSELSKELYLNNGDLTFTGQDLPFDEGAIGDFNNDGYLDVVNDGNLFINNGSGNNWFKVRLEGVDSNINGIGAKVKLYGDWGMQLREVRSGHSFSPMNSLNTHFGIGTATNIDRVVIEWPSGQIDEYLNPDINTQQTYVEGGNPLAVTEFDKEGISLYPNPTVATLNFSLPGLENMPVSVIDVNGRLVLETQVSASNHIDVSSLQGGVYFAQFNIEDNDVNYKFVKN